jgi:hypothetical protein
MTTGFRSAIIAATSLLSQALNSTLRRKAVREW